MSKPGKSLRTLCKRLKVRLTVKRGKKRVYKSVAVLKRQCANKKSKKRRKFGSSPTTKQKRNSRKKKVKRKQKLTKKSFLNLIDKIMSVIMVGNTFRYLIQDISKTHKRLKGDRNKTQKLIDDTVDILKNRNNTSLLDIKFQFQAFEAESTLSRYFRFDGTVHSGFDSVQYFIDYLNNL